MRLVHLAITVAILLGAAGLSACGPQWPRPAEILVSTVPSGAACVVSRGGQVLGTVDPTPGIILVERSPEVLIVHCRRSGFRDAEAALPARAVAEYFFDSRPAYEYDGPVALVMSPIAPR